MDLSQFTRSYRVPIDRPRAGRRDGCVGGRGHGNEDTAGPDPDRDRIDATSGVSQPRGLCRYELPADLAWDHGLRHDRRGRYVAEPWDAVQWSTSLGAGISHLEEQQSRALGSRTERLEPVKYRNQGERAVAPGWALIFDLQAGFDPYSLQFANGIGSWFKTPACR